MIAQVPAATGVESACSVPPVQVRPGATQHRAATLEIHKVLVLVCGSPEVFPPEASTQAFGNAGELSDGLCSSTTAAVSSES